MSEANKETTGTLSAEPANLYFFTPYSLEGRLGRAYNKCMELVPRDDDWACFLDRDVMFLTPDFGHQISEIIRMQPGAGLLTCLTNRVGCRAQLYQCTSSDNPNILHHRAVAENLRTKQRHAVEEIPGPVSGFLLVLRKAVWRQLRFNEDKQLLDVDWEFSRRLVEKGFSILLMRGLYVFHYYRLEGGPADVAHLK